jgi:hypothetical protein
MREPIAVQTKPSSGFRTVINPKNTAAPRAIGCVSIFPSFWLPGTFQQVGMPRASVNTARQDSFVPPKMADVFVGSPLVRFDPVGPLGTAERKAHPRASLAPASAALTRHRDGGPPLGRAPRAPRPSAEGLPAASRAGAPFDFFDFRFEKIENDVGLPPTRPLHYFVTTLAQIGRAGGTHHRQLPARPIAPIGDGFEAERQLHGPLASSRQKRTIETARGASRGRQKIANAFARTIYAQRRRLSSMAITATEAKSPSGDFIKDCIAFVT